MPAITYSDFSGGLDRRLPVSAQDASRLWVLKNAYVTTGKRIKKRPGLSLVSASLSGSVGLAAANGRLKVFVEEGSTFSPPSSVDKVELTHPTDVSASYPLERIYSAWMFGGYLYVVAEYDPAGLYVGGGTATIPRPPPAGWSV